ncbi:MAG: cobyrinate a,c-diamide synthase [Faecousia sp.]
MEKKLPRVLIAGTNSGCGKTTVVCAVLQALKNRGEVLASFKCGPDYIDPMFHSAVLGLRCRNLDLHFFEENTLRCLLSQGEGCAVIEGVMGYYDGVGTGCEASSYAVAKAADAPAVLVVNARGAAHSILAVLGGFAGLYPDSGIRGVILNNCSHMLYPKLKALILEHFAGTIQPLGFLPPMPDCSLESRHLGLVTAEEISNLQEKLGLLAENAEKNIDLDGLLALARSAPALRWEPFALPRPGSAVRIAVARDRAFCFYYEDNFRLLEQLGAELLPFSPLEDDALPENIQGLYLGGGYPELHAKALGENETMRASIRRALEHGLPCIAECGGFLYLQEKLLEQPMVGFLKGSGFYAGHLVRFGYATLTANRDGMLLRRGETLSVHEFHYYDVDDPGDAFTAKKASGSAWNCGVVSDTLYAGFPHLHFYAKPEIAARFLALCRRAGKEQNP